MGLTTLPVKPGSEAVEAWVERMTQKKPTVRADLKWSIAHGSSVSIQPTAQPKPAHGSPRRRGPREGPVGGAT
jgi:hypothetical protein